MTQDEIIKALRDMAKYPTVTLPRDSEALKAAADLLAQPEQCQCPNCKVTLHASDCAVHSGPAYPAGGCDCGAQPYPENFIDALTYDVARRDFESAQQEPVAVVSGYYGGQCVILPIDPARIFNSNTALYTKDQL